MEPYESGVFADAC